MTYPDREPFLRHSASTERQLARERSAPPDVIALNELEDGDAPYVEVRNHPNGGYTIYVGDGVRVRVTSDGNLRVRAANHTLRLAWLTNQPTQGSVSVAGLELTRKDHR